MNRRNFLKASLASAMAVSGCIGMGVPSVSLAGTINRRTIVNLMLLGGADLRYLFIPHPNHIAGGNNAYVSEFWTARKALYSGSYSADLTGYTELYANDYTTITTMVDGSEFKFGVPNSCGWLIEQFNANNVAIVANAFG